MDEFSTDYIYLINDQIAFAVRESIKFSDCDTYEFKLEKLY